MKQHRTDRWFLPLFLGAETVLYLIFLVHDLRTGVAGLHGVKYAGILLCLVMALYSARRGGDRYVAAAMALTAAADTLLLMLDMAYGVGVAVFLAVQTLYLLRLRRAEGGRWLPGLRAAAIVAVPVLLWACGMLTPLNVLAGAYFTFLLCNLLQSLTGRAPWGRLFGLGLLLFAGCDVCVGLNNNQALIPPALFAFSEVGMWLFYLPSQVLIVCSGLPGKEE